MNCGFWTKQLGVPTQCVVDIRTWNETRGCHMCIGLKDSEGSWV